MPEQKEIRQLYTWAFEGEFPDIPIPQEINMDELLGQGTATPDNDPMFVTLPFAENGAVADDGLRYTEGFNSKITATINSNRPVGNMGHIRPEDRGSTFPVPPVIWLAAMEDQNGRHWAKGYVMPDQNVREFVRVSKATKRGVATSIYGFSDFDAMQFNADGTYEIDPRGFELESLDLAPIERAALKIDRPIQLTSHMSNSKDSNEMPELTPELIAQLKPEQLPTAVRDAIIAQYKEQNENKTLVEQLQNENKDLATLVAQLKDEVDLRDGELFENRLNAFIEDEAKLDDPVLVEIVKNSTLLHMAGKREIESAKVFVAQYMESDSYKKIATAFVAQATGGKAIVSTGNSGKSLGEEMESRVAEIKAKYGI